MARLGWPEGHGARLRKERRKFAREEASALVKASMAELERRELGETRRVERGEVGATRRVGMEEAGLGERLGREQEFARPLQAAETRRIGALAGLRGAEAEKVRYGTEFEKGLEETLKGIVGAKRRVGEAVAEERELGLSEERRRLRFGEATEEEAARPLVGEEVPTTLKRPVGRAKPFIEEILGYTLPGGSAYSPMRDWLKRGREEEFAYPGAR